MPLYEYSCRTCDHRFEVLQSMGAGSDDVACAACGDSQVQRELSTFATTGSSGDAWAGDCGSEAAQFGGCGAGACGAPHCSN